MTNMVVGSGDTSRRPVRNPTAMLHTRKRRPSERDNDVGRRVKARRLEMRLSQSQLGEKIGVTFQQVQKYEKGTNRIGAGRLALLSEALKVPVTFFFSNDTIGALPKETKIANQVSNVFALAQSGAAVRLMTAFSKIDSRKKRLLIVEMAEEMAR